MRKLIVATVATLLVFSLGSMASGGEPGFMITVDPTSGTAGTTVTVTGYGCGTFDGEFFIGTGQLVVTVPGWGGDFETGIAGSTNDGDGVVSVTFVVPEVEPGTYAIQASCVETCAPQGVRANACAVPEVRASQFGSYAPGSFTVTAPAATPAQTPAAVPAQANTAG